MNIADAALFAPSIRQMVDNMSDVLLATGRSLVVVVPAGILPFDVWDLLRSELGRRDADIRDLQPLETERTPADLLALAFGVHITAVNGPQTIEAVLAQADRAGQYPDVLYLDQFDQATLATCNRWYVFLEHWAEIMRQRVNQGQRAIALCAIVQATAWDGRVLHHSQMLEMRWWWGAPSVVETRLLCRAQTLGGECREAWREYVLPTVASGDVDLITFFWDHIIDEWDRLTHHLCLYADSRGWNLEKLKMWGAEGVWAHLHQPLGGVSSSISIEPRFRVLWEQGALQWTVEHGVELNIAALAYLGRDDLINYRLWRGQVQYVLPMVNGLRLATCDHLATVYGSNWPKLVQPPDNEREYQALIKNPNSCEFGHLKKVIDSRDNAAKWDRWKLLVDRAKKVRDTIAHYQPISYAAFEELWILRARIAGG